MVKVKKKVIFWFLGIFSTGGTQHISGNISILFSVIDYITYPKMKKFLVWEPEIDPPECSKECRRGLWVALIAS